MAIFKWAWEGISELVASSALIEHPIQNRNGIILPKVIPDVSSTEYRASLVNIIQRIIKAKKKREPQTTSDLAIEMFSIDIQRLLSNGNVYIERNWWIPTNHPLINYIEAIAVLHEPSWTRKGIVRSEQFGSVCIYSNETMIEVFRELQIMFSEQGIMLDDHLPPSEEEEEEEYEDDEEDEKGKMDEIVIDGMGGGGGDEGGKNPTEIPEYSVLQPREGSKKGD